ncbi:hypothetical protein M433DRAFT_160343, partial [Acidomyces richmondensis BFW]
MLRYKNLEEQINSLSWLNVSVGNELGNVSGHVDCGTMMAILGHSGSGASTLLRVLGQRIRCSGNFYINGREVDLQEIRKTAAYVGDNDSLVNALTAAETLNFAAHLAQGPTEISKADENLSTGELKWILSPKQDRARQVKGLSRSERKRLRIAIQLLTGSKVLLLDEPTSGLDNITALTVMKYVASETRRRNLIAIVSLPQPTDPILDLFHQVLVLSEGHVLFDGAVKPLREHLQPPKSLADELIRCSYPYFGAHENFELQSALWKLQVVTTPSLDRFKLLEGMICPFYVPIEPFEAGGAEHKLIKLVQRSWTKSCRDPMVYIIRLPVYFGLSIFLGTIWFRLQPSQTNIESFVSAIFFSAAFMSLTAICYIPTFLEDLATFYSDHGTGFYGPFLFLIANTLISVSVSFGNCRCYIRFQYTGWP